MASNTDLRKMDDRVLFIHPGDLTRTYQQLSESLSAIDTPLWPLLGASYLENKGYKTVIHDTNLDGWSNNTATSLIGENPPCLTIVLVYGHQPSASTQTMPAAIEIVKNLKESHPHLKIALGGTHPSALPEKTLRETGADYILDGEAFNASRLLIESILKEESIQGIPGLSYLDNDGAFIQGPQAEKVIDLDEHIPTLSWHLLHDLNRYRAHNWHCFQNMESEGESARSPYISLYTSLGCPYNCHFCCIKAVFGKGKVRFWSVKTVMNWLDQLAGRYEFLNIRIADELFCLDHSRVEEFCDAVILKGYKFNIWVYARVDTISEKLLAKMRLAGISWISLGIESGSVKVRNEANKGYLADIHDVVNLIQKHGIHVMGNFIFGLPEDDHDSMRQTLNLALDLKCDFVNFYCAMAYPGSALYRQAIGNGWPLPENWNGFSQHSYDTLPLPTNHLSPAEVLSFRDEAFIRYFSDKNYLDFVQRVFGEKTVSHLKEMTEITRVRLGFCMFKNKQFFSKQEYFFS
jgi:radical SAM superfamily enzyme YgiQ (UPF0313 family)